MTEDLDLFSIRPEDKIPAKGKVLISEPFLRDTFFNRSIVLITEHNEEGTIGFILNKNLEISLSQTLDGFENFDEILSMGGPVQPDTLHYIHTIGGTIPGSMLISKGLWWGGDLETIRDLISIGNITGKDIRFFLGYSGWGKGQLADELKENSWVIADVSPSWLMDNSTPDIWKNVVRSLNSRYRIWADFPVSPDMN